MDEPGTYKVRVFTSRHWRRSFAEGARITLKVDDNTPFNSVLMKKDGELSNVRQNSYPETWSDIGTVHFKQKGTKGLELSVNATGTFSRLGFFGEDIENRVNQRSLLMFKEQTILYFYEITFFNRGQSKREEPHGSSL